MADVSPGYLRDLVPAEAPEKGEHWKAVMTDIEKVIMPGVTHWASPHFHGYFPAGNSYPSIVADILSGAINCIGFSWIASPACTELEMLTIDWLATALNLPKEFLFADGSGKGGGVIQGSVSEATLVAMLSARTEQTQEGKIGIENLVAYCSVEAHCSAERAGLLAGVKMRLIETDQNFSLRGEALKAAIESDKKQGLTPFFVVATLGTTNSCAFDNLIEVGQVCRDLDIWLHVDAAYAGSAFICSEFRHLLDGVEYVDTFTFSPHKWMLVNYDCTVMFVKDSSRIVDAFNMDPVYMKHKHQDDMPDFRHWHIPMGRRFRSLKLWFVMRIYGLEGIRKNIRDQVALAAQFAEFVSQEDRLEMFTEQKMSLVSFRVKDSNILTNELLIKINDAKRIHLTPAKVAGKYIIRFAVGSRRTESSDISLAWTEVVRNLDLMEENKPRILKVKFPDNDLPSLSIRIPYQEIIDLKSMPQSNKEDSETGRDL